MPVQIALGLLNNAQHCLTYESPLSGAVCVATVEQHVRVVAWPVHRVRLHEGAELRAQRVPRHAAAGVITATRVHHVVGEEALHAVQHACGAQVQLLHLVGGQQGGLAIHAGTDGNIFNQGLENSQTSFCFSGFLIFLDKSHFTAFSTIYIIHGCSTHF